MLLETTLEKVGRVLSEQYGITLVCRGSQCCTDGKTIMLPSLPDTVPEHLMPPIRAFLDHEVGHIVSETDFPLGKTFREERGEAAFGILNLLEDLRTDAVMRSRYPGSVRNLSAGFAMTLRDVKEAPPYRQAVIAMYALGSGYAMPPCVEPEMQALAESLRAKLARARSAPTTRALIPDALAIWEKVKALCEAKQKPQTADRKQDTSSQRQASGNLSDSERQSSQDTGSQGPSSKPKRRQTGTESPGQSEAGTSPRPDPTFQDATAQELASGVVLSQGDPASGQAAQESGGIDVSNLGLGSRLAQMIQSSVSDYAASNSVYRIWSTELDRVEVPTGDASITARKAMEKIPASVRSLRSRLLQCLMSESRSFWLSDKERGHLDPRTLHRLATGSSNRVFRQLVRHESPSTAVTLLVDLSYSMREKLLLTRQTALVFAEALDLLNISNSVIGFSTDDAKPLHARMVRQGFDPGELEQAFRAMPLVHTVFKPFHESFQTAACRFMEMHAQSMTPLGESLLFAGRQLAPRLETRKIVFCLTDGKPYISRQLQAVTYQHAKDTIARLERCGIEVVLIGIQEQCVKDLHSRSVVVSNLNELPITVMRQLKQVLRQRMEGTREAAHACPVS